MIRVIVMTLALAGFGFVALAVEPGEMLDDPELESRARALSADLRCVVCQNQSIDDSNAPLARDLRVLLRDRLLEGDTDEKAIAFIVERYGDYVMLRPPVRPSTYLLWAAPFIVLLVGAVLVYRLLLRQRRRSDASDDDPAVRVTDTQSQ